MSLQLNTTTKESYTADGTVEYDAVECARCEYDTPTEDATMVILPTYARYKDHAHGASGMKIEHADDAPAAALCPECSESVFAPDLHKNNYQKRLADWTQERERRFFLLLFAHILGLLLATTGLLCILMGVPP
jgi:hypothetical protein